MIYMITGVPGAGKTVEALTLLQGMHVARPDRNVYVSNVRGFRFDMLPWAKPLEHVRDWQDLPDGSIVLVDEVQDQIPQRDAKVPVPEWVKELAKHRHRGFDFIFVTQSGANVDVFLRRQVGEHRYIRRKPRALSFMTGFRAGSVRITWDRYEPKCDDFLAQRKAVKSGAVWDKSVFTWYESTTLDTHKPKAPFVVYLIPVGALVCVFLIWRVVDRLTAEDEAVAPVPTAAAVATPEAEAADSGVSPPAAADGLTAERPAQVDHVMSLVPRHEGIPWSAPAYDGLSVQSYPRVYCYIGTSNGCKCVTQQNTRIPIKPDLCLTIVRDGLFDPFRPDEVSGQGATGSPGQNADISSPEPVASPSAPVASSSSAGAYDQIAAYGGFRQ